jgi:hypothetical protein
MAERRGLGRRSRATAGARCTTEEPLKAPRQQPATARLGKKIEQKEEGKS